MDIEKRKIIVGISGIDPRDERLIEIVFRHSQYNLVEFELQQKLDLQTCEILLVNPVAAEGLKALTRLRRGGRSVPVVSVVPRAASPGSRYAIALDRLTLQLLPILNRVVAEQFAGADAADPAVPTDKRPLPRRATDPGETSLADAALDTFRHDGVVAAPLAATPAVSTEGLEKYMHGSGAAASPELLAEAEVSHIVPVATLASANGWPLLHLPSAHVLIVDESLIARQQLQRAVESLGILCSTVASAEQALALCESSRFDLVFVEIVLPGMNGFGLTRELRQRHPDMPVIILSCRSSPLDMVRAALAGSAKYLVKPVRMFWFRKALEEYLQQSLLRRYNLSTVCPAPQLQSATRQGAMLGAAESRLAGLPAQADNLSEASPSLATSL